MSYRQGAEESSVQVSTGPVPRFHTASSEPAGQSSPKKQRHPIENADECVTLKP